MNYQWQGEPVSVKFGYTMVKENKEKPLWWYNFECNVKQNIHDEYIPSYGTTGMALIPSIQVSQGNSVFIIANHFGIGVSKLIKGGWPNHSHFSVNGEFTEDNDFAIYEFDELSYSKHESERNKWQKENYHDEYKKLEDMRNSFKKFKL